ncbi:MAG: hypothetical protein KF901_16080 [Myxococcales bacterium]|nr:hypothetical protein [Myxococcales bacterium]
MTSNRETPLDHCYEPLLARRVPHADVVAGRGYVIHARNGGVGVAVRDGNRLGYRLRRQKFDRIFLFVEWDWAEGPPYGTAIPLQEVATEAPADERDWIGWLEALEAAYADEIREAWETVWRSMIAGRGGAAG